MSVPPSMSRLARLNAPALAPTYVAILDAAVFLFVPPAPLSIINKSASTIASPISVPPSISNAPISTLPAVEIVARAESARLEILTVTSSPALSVNVIVGVLNDIDETVVLLSVTAVLVLSSCVIFPPSSAPPDAVAFIIISSPESSSREIPAFKSGSAASYFWVTLLHARVVQ